MCKRRRSCKEEEKKNTTETEYSKRLEREKIQQQQQTKTKRNTQNTTEPVAKQGHKLKRCTKKRKMKQNIKQREERHKT